MAYPRIAYKNYWRDGTIIALDDEHPQYPAEDTQQDSRQFVWRSVDAPTAATAIDCDFGAAYEYDFIALLGHNLTAGATIEVIGADDDAFSVNDVTDTLTYRGNDIFEILGTARTKRYVRLSIVDTGNPSGYLQVGPIFVGKARALNRKNIPGHARGYVNPTETEEVPAGVEFKTRAGASREARELTFLTLNEISAGYIRSLLEECASHQAFAFILDPTAPGNNTLWVVLTNQALMDSNVYQHWDWAAAIKEVL
jgi:hypothetical protein